MEMGYAKNNTPIKSPESSSMTHEKMKKCITNYPIWRTKLRIESTATHVQLINTKNDIEIELKKWIKR